MIQTNYNAKIKYMNEQQKYNENKRNFQKLYKHIKKNNPFYFSKKGVKIEYIKNRKKIKLKIRTKNVNLTNKKEKILHLHLNESNFYKTYYSKMKKIKDSKSIFESPIDNIYTENEVSNKKVGSKIIQMKGYNNNILENAINHKNVKFVFDNNVDEESYTFYDSIEYDLFHSNEIKNSIFKEEYFNIKPQNEFELNIIQSNIQNKVPYKNIVQKANYKKKIKNDSKK